MEEGFNAFVIDINCSLEVFDRIVMVAHIFKH
jgi:hypothetical protein